MRDSQGRFIRVYGTRTKVCGHCQSEYTPAYNNYARSKFCSRSCRSKSHPSGHQGKKHSQAARERIGNAVRGEKHPNWYADRSKIKTGDRILHDPLQKQWRRAVKDRDRWQCRFASMLCAGRLEAHHIKPWKEYPALRFDVSNGITLCHKHHPRKAAEVQRLAPRLQALALTPLYHSQSQSS